MSPDTKLRDGWTKWIFRKAIEPFLPPAVVWRKDKQGFANPQSVWLYSDLRPQIEKIFSPGMRAEELGLVDQRALTLAYRRYCRQKGSGTVPFKNILQPLFLERWLRRFDGYLKSS